MIPAFTNSSGNLIGRSILVVGGGGFIGSHACQALTALGAKVRIFGRSPPMFTVDAEFTQGVLDDAAGIVPLAKHSDTVVILTSASSPATGNANFTREVVDHVEKTVALIELCQANGVTKIVFSSSGGTVYGGNHQYPTDEDALCMPRNAYGVSKLAIENYLRVIGMLKGISTISLRISNPYGPFQVSRGQGFIAAVAEKLLSHQRIDIWGDGKVVRDFIHVSDVATAIALACQSEVNHSTVNIGSGTGVDLLSIIKLLESAAEVKADLRFLEERNIDVKYNVLCNKLANSVFGWSPRISLSAGLADTIRWWRTQKPMGNSDRKLFMRA